MQALLSHPISIDEMRGRVNSRLDALMPVRLRGPCRVNAAARYALLAPGKRIRPLMTLLAARQYGATIADALDVACATEMVHTASLVLDDLPSMDDADTRRGQPTAHRSFGESTAILAAVALLNKAFATIACSSHLSGEIRILIVERLSDAVGLDGLVGGQESDLNERGGAATMVGLERLNRQKTSVLFEAALELGARVAGIGDRRITDLRQAAAHLGLAYQIADDIFDTGDPAPARPPSKDLNKDHGKPTIVSLLGVTRAREKIGHHVSQALSLLPCEADGAEFLRGYIRSAFIPAAAG